MDDFTKTHIKKNNIINMNKIHDYFHIKEKIFHFNNLFVNSEKLKHKLLELNGLLKINNKDL
jgi:hypothetical protein